MGAISEQLIVKLVLKDVRASEDGDGGKSSRQMELNECGRVRLIVVLCGCQGLRRYVEVIQSMTECMARSWAGKHHSPLCVYK